MANHSICSIPDCGKVSIARGWCNVHYTRWRTGRDISAPTSTTHHDTRRFIERCLATKSGRCIHWPYSKLPKGYGRINIGGRDGYAHRLVCEKAHGPSPSPKHQAAHSCGNASCCNPSHIRWATQAENDADKRLHGTYYQGEKSPSAKLTEAQVKEILAIGRNLSQSKIAAMYGISSGHVGGIQARKFWAHIQPD